MDEDVDIPLDARVIGPASVVVRDGVRNARVPILVRIAGDHAPGGRGRTFPAHLYLSRGPGGGIVVETIIPNPPTGGDAIR